jgi:plastocyanin
MRSGWCGEGDLKGSVEFVSQRRLSPEGDRMRIRRLVPALAAAAALAVPAPGGAARTVKIAINNFRFCPTAPCDAQDTAWVAGQSVRPQPEAAPQYNSDAVIDVKPGDTVQWTYRDSGPPPSCDSFDTDAVRCPGHEVRFVDATNAVGFVPRESTRSFTWKVPANAPKGRIYPYYCAVANVHYRFGMTGALRVT